MAEVTLTALKNLGKVTDGDILVVTIPKSTTMDEVQACRRHMDKEFPDNQVVLVVQGFDLEKRKRK